MIDRIVALDPGYDSAGLAVLHRIGGEWVPVEWKTLRSPQVSEKIEPRAAVRDTIRVGQMVRSLELTFAAWGIRDVVSELPSGARDASAARCLSLAIGSLVAIQHFMQLNIEWHDKYWTREVTVPGHRKLGSSHVKPKIVAAMRLRFPQVNWNALWVYEQEAIADALSVAVCSLARGKVML